MSVSTAASNPYDEVPYLAHPVTQSHIDRIAAVAKLFGMRPPETTTCRVLELGCAMGSNIIPMAEQFPQARFVGIDFSARQIQAGQRAIELLGLTNLELRHQSILDFDDTAEPFDYIIAHGVFSWVPREVQDKILAICSANLSPQGVSFVSYNTQPGWHLRSVVRDMLLSCCSPAEPSMYRVAKCRKVLEFLKYALSQEKNAYSEVLKSHVETLQEQADSYLVHEYLAESNSPLYFNEFARWAADHRLAYLSDCPPGTMFPVNLGPTVAQNLLELGSELIVSEQHLDLLRNRPFRQSLLCHQNARLNRQVTAASFEGLYVAGNLHPQNPPVDLASPHSATFLTSPGVGISVSTAVAKAGILLLGKVWPRALSLDEIVSSIKQMLVMGGATANAGVDDRAIMGECLAQGLAAGMIEVFANRDGFSSTAQDRPRALSLARHEAGSGTRVTTFRHNVVVLDELSRHVLRHLDGLHDREMLLKILAEATERGDLSILKNGMPAGGGPAVRPLLEDALENSLKKLASQALLFS